MASRGKPATSTSLPTIESTSVLGINRKKFLEFDQQTGEILKFESLHGETLRQDTTHSIIGTRWTIESDGSSNMNTGIASATRFQSVFDSATPPRIIDTVVPLSR